MRRRSHGLRLGLLIALSASLACSTDEQSAAESPAGDAAVAPVWGDSLTLVEEARVGVLDGDPDYELGRVYSMAIGKDNAFIVADDGVPSLRVYDSTGTFVRVIGRMGDGPGEYRSMGGVRTLPDGRIVLWDNRRRLLTTYSDTGAVLVTASVPSGLFSSDLLQVTRDGTAWVRTMLVSLENLENPNPLQPRRVDDGWVRIAPDGTVMDTIVAPTATFEEPEFVLSGPAGYDRPFNRKLVSAVSVLGELVSGDNASYTFARQPPGGDAAEVSHPYTPIAVRGGERAEFESWAKRFEEQARNRPERPGVVNLTPRNVRYRIPDTKPPFKALVGDADGRIWVHRYVLADSLPGAEREPGDDRPRRTWKEPPTFDVFSPDGAFLGTVTLPRNTRFADAKGMQLWVIGSGELGEDFVARYRIAQH